MNDKLKPCPACKSDELIVYEANKDGFYVQCENCEMRGPRKDDEDVAINVWNNLSNSLHWTIKIPTEPGWYFSRTNSIVNVVLLGSSPEGLCILGGGKLCLINGFSYGSRAVEWAGPISEPIENK